MNQALRTSGEILFEQYLESQSLPFEFEKKHAGKSKRPDYTIDWNGSPIIFDVKDFDAPDKLPTGFGFFDPYTRIREKIEQGREKFKEYKDAEQGPTRMNQSTRRSSATIPPGQA